MHLFSAACFAWIFLWVPLAQNAHAADPPPDGLRRGIGWISKPGVAVCIDPAGYFISNVPRNAELDRDFTIHVPVQSVSRGLAVTSSRGSPLSIHRVDGADLFPIAVAPSLPPLPSDVTVMGYNPSSDLAIHTFAVKQARISPANTPQRPGTSETTEAKLEGLTHDEFPDGAALTDARGQLIGLLLPGPLRNVHLFTATEVSQQLRDAIDEQRHQDARDAARTALGPDASRPAPPAPIPPHLSAVLPSLAAVCAKDVPTGATAVCVDSFGLYITYAVSLQGHNDLILVRKDSAGHRTRLTAKPLATDNHTGLTALLADTPEPLPYAPLSQFPRPTGALYATKITCLSPDAYHSIQNTIDLAALRGRLHWQWNRYQQEAQFHRDAFIAPAPPGALFDDSGVFLGMTRHAVPPNVEDAAIISSLDALFPKPAIAFLTPSVTASTLTAPRDFYFHVYGLKPADNPAVRLSLGAFGTWRAFDAQRVRSSEFVVRGVSLASGPASRVDYKVECLINNAVADTRTGQLGVGGATPAAVATDNVRELKENRVVSLPLPGNPTDPTVGGNGRYLIFECNHTGNFKTIAILDVPAANLRTLDIPTVATVRCAAGAEKLVVVESSKGELRRFDLETLKLETTSVLPDEEQSIPQQVVMGSGSRGPVVIGRQRGLSVIDLATLQPLPNATPGIRRLQYITSTASGRMVTGWPGAAGTTILHWNGTTFSVSAPVPGLSPRDVFPDPDGDRIYTGRGPVVLAAQTGTPPNSRTDARWPLADTSEFCFTPSANPANKTVSASIFHAQSQRPILTVPLDELKSSVPSSFERNIWVFAACGRVVVLPPGQRKVVLHPADIDRAMGDRPGLLCFTSVPPRVARTGETLKYKIQAASARDDTLKFTLDHGPQGMQLNSEGELTWTIPATAKGTAAEVVVSVKDAAAVTGTHKFTVYVE